ncbi:MAG: sulfotransferase domain-containing protein [Roseiarcus sp.]
MSTRILKTQAGETEITIATPGQFRSFFLFAMHKSGSTLLNNMMTAALSSAEIPVIDLAWAAFSAGLPENRITNADEFVFDNGYCYLGFRIYAPYLKQFDLSGNKKILLVRDPRDMLVSYYFSMAKSHGIPDTGVIRESMLSERKSANTSNIDEYCLGKVKNFKSEFASYRHLTSDKPLDSNVKIYRYEDVIFSKFEWLRDMLTYLSVPFDVDNLRAIAKKNDVWPDKERPEHHVRQVKPGNFRQHLSDKTIDILNIEFKNEFETYGYSI